jgi:hypothetical protein
MDSSGAADEMGPQISLSAVVQVRVHGPVCAPDHPFNRWLSLDQLRHAQCGQVNSIRSPSRRSLEHTELWDPAAPTRVATTRRVLTE